MEWAYDRQTDHWQLTVGGWEAQVKRLYASLEYTAQIISPAPEHARTQAPHIFSQLEAAQGWCIQAIASRQSA